LQTVAELPKIAEVANSCKNCQQLQKLPTIAKIANNCKNCQQLQKLPMAAVVAAVAEKGCNSGFKLVIAKNQKTVTNTNFIQHNIITVWCTSSINVNSPKFKP